MQLEIKQHSCQRPKNGIWYHEEDGFRFEGDSADDTAEKVSKYRLGHGKPLGDPLQDVLRSVAKDYPHLFQKVCGQVKNTEPTLGDELQAWALEQKHALVDMEIELIANARESVCLKCPHHVEFGFPSQEEIDRYEGEIAKITRGCSMKRKRLNGCEKYKMDCRVMVYSKSDTLPDNDLPYCWIKQDLSDFLDS